MSLVRLTPLLRYYPLVMFPLFLKITVEVLAPVSTWCFLSQCPVPGPTCLRQPNITTIPKDSSSCTFANFHPFSYHQYIVYGASATGVSSSLCRFAEFGGLIPITSKLIRKVWALVVDRCVCVPYTAKCFGKCAGCLDYAD